MKQISRLKLTIGLAILLGYAITQIVLSAQQVFARSPDEKNQTRSAPSQFSLMLEFQKLLKPQQLQRLHELAKTQGFAVKYIGVKAPFAELQTQTNSLSEKKVKEICANLRKTIWIKNCQPTKSLKPGYREVTVPDNSKVNIDQVSSDFPIRELRSEQCQLFADVQEVEMEGGKLSDLHSWEIHGIDLAESDRKREAAQLTPQRVIMCDTRDQHADGIEALAQGHNRLFPVTSYSCETEAELAQAIDQELQHTSDNRPIRLNLSMELESRFDQFLPSTLELLQQVNTTTVAGNGYLNRQKELGRGALQLEQTGATIVSGSDERGITGRYSVSGRKIAVQASGENTVVCPRNSSSCSVFEDGTSAAAAKVFYGQNSVREILPQIDNSTLTQMMIDTGIRLPQHFLSPPRDGEASINLVKLRDVAWQLRKLCQERTHPQNCYQSKARELSVTPVNFSGINSKVMRSFPSCSSQGDRAAQPQVEKCTRYSDLQELRRQAFLDPRNREWWQILACIYRKEKLPASAAYYENIERNPGERPFRSDEPAAASLNPRLAQFMRPSEAEKYIRKIYKSGNKEQKKGAAIAALDLQIAQPRQSEIEKLALEGLQYAGSSALDYYNELKPALVTPGSRKKLLLSAARHPNISLRTHAIGHLIAEDGDLDVDAALMSRLADVNGKVRDRAYRAIAGSPRRAKFFDLIFYNSALTDNIPIQRGGLAMIRYFPESERIPYLRRAMNIQREKLQLMVLNEAQQFGDSGTSFIAQQVNHQNPLVRDKASRIFTKIRRQRSRRGFRQ